MWLPSSRSIHSTPGFSGLTVSLNSPWEAFCCSPGLSIAPEPLDLTDTETPLGTELWRDQWYPRQWCFHDDWDLSLLGVVSANGMSCQQVLRLLSSSALPSNTQLLLLPSPLPSCLIWFDVSAGCDFSKLLFVNQLPSAGTKRYQLTLGSPLCSTSENIRKNWRLWFQPISPVSYASHPNIRKVNNQWDAKRFPNTYSWSFLFLIMKLSPTTRRDTREFVSQTRTLME